jgi:hypothetical protein
MWKKIIASLTPKAKQEEDSAIPLIEFICEPNDWDVIPKPVPAYKVIPDWFKKIPPTLPLGSDRDHFGASGMTAKKCLPLLDGMSAGYIMPLAMDVNIRSNGDNKLIDSSSNHAVQFHGVEQLGGKTSPTYPGPAIKFINRWIIKTRPGWSTLFIPPLNQLEDRFTCLSALVDTDRYHKQVNFPAIWHAKDHDDLVRAGTPLVLAIPVLRSSLQEEAIMRVMTEEERAEVARIGRVQDTRRHYYTQELREPR